MKTFFWFILTLSCYPENAQGVKLVEIKELSNKRVDVCFNSRDTIINARVVNICDVCINILFATDNK